MRIGACQTAEIIGDIDQAVRTIWDFAERADTEQVDLLLFPECFLQGYLVSEQHLHDHALDITSEDFAAVLTDLAGIGQTLVLGMIERSGSAHHNSALVISAGRIIGRYRKMFLTVGESLFTPGDDYPVFDCHGLTFGINICHDTQLAEAAAAVAAGGAQVLLVPAQNMMRRTDALWWQDRHNTIRAERARETGMWLISADVTGQRDNGRVGLGPTCVISPTGQVLTQVPTGTTGIAILDTQPPMRSLFEQSPASPTLPVDVSSIGVRENVTEKCRHGVPNGG